MSRDPVGVRYFVAAALLFLFALWPQVPTAATPAAEIKLPSLDAVLEDLKKGGMVIYLRHATTNRKGANDDKADMARCETQRNLSDAGRAEARAIGEAFRTLYIPIGIVLAGPFCRVRETATLAFGKAATHGDLYSAGSVKDRAEGKRMAEALRVMLGTIPASGSNTVLVSHNGNLRDATGFWPDKEGMAFIFRPLGDGKAEGVASVLAEDWIEAAKRALPQASN